MLRLSISLTCRMQNSQTHRNREWNVDCQELGVRRGAGDREMLVKGHKGIMFQLFKMSKFWRSNIQKVIEVNNIVSYTLKSLEEKLLSVLTTKKEIKPHDGGC